MNNKTEETEITTNTSPYAAPKATLTSAKNRDREPCLWNPNAAANWCIIFTPVFGALLQSKNWEELGEPEKAKASKIWIYITIVVAAVSMAANFTNGGLIMLITWYIAEGKNQSKYLKDNDISYIKKPWLKVLSIATGILFIFVAIIIAITITIEQ